jgi:septum formation protein
MLYAPDFVLASSSPRRRELLQQIGARFVVRPVAMDESHLPGEKPQDYVRRLALAKAELGLMQDDSLPVMGADTTVVVDDMPLGKPESEADGLAILQRLSGRCHQVMTAVALVSGRQRAVCTSVTTVTFATLSLEQCRHYWRTSEPLDKAGAYAIQGLGAVFVTRIEGSYSGVVGLPLAESAQLLAQFGISCWHLEV